MYIAKIPNRSSAPTYLLRESYRQNGKVKNRTLANLSTLPLTQIRLIARVLKGQNLLPADQQLRILRSLPHGHVHAVLSALRQLRVDSLIASQPSRQRDLVVAMIAQRILHPSSKLAAVRLWESTTLGEELHVLNADVDELYAALDWLLSRQKRIENKLARRHLADGARVLYDVSSSSYFGHCCPLARFGHNRDGRRDLPCIVYGLMTDADGRPIALDVYPGNTADPTTVPDQVEKLRERFGLNRVVLVGDRGMLTQTQIDRLRERPGLGWLSALRPEAIRKLIADGRLERSLFDQRNLAEIVSPDFPDERLVACFNPLLADRRRRKREALLEATEKELTRIAKEVSRRKKTPLKRAEIGVKVGKVLNKRKVGKHFALTIEDGVLEWRRKLAAIEVEAAMDGIYVIRGSEQVKEWPAADAVRHYKELGDVEKAFRTLKGLELSVRPIHHRVEDRVRAHMLVCMLAYYVEWHMKRAWASLLFADEHLAEHRAERDAVLQARPAAEVRRKKATRRNEAGDAVHSFRTLLAALGVQCRQTCQLGEGESAVLMTRSTDATALQSKAFDLLQQACSQ